MLLRSAGN